MFRQLMTVFALAICLVVAPAAMAEEAPQPRLEITEWVGQWLVWLGVVDAEGEARVALEKSADEPTDPAPPVDSDPLEPTTEIGMTIDPNG